MPVTTVPSPIVGTKTIEIAPDGRLWLGFRLLAGSEAVPLAPQGRYITPGSPGGILDECGLTNMMFRKKKSSKQISIEIFFGRK